MSIIEFIQQPWHWSVSGLMIALVMFILIFMGKRFGVSSNLRTMCAIGGAGSKVSYFNFDWKADRWNLLFILGAVIGGFLASSFLMSPEPVNVSTETVSHLNKLGINTPQTIQKGTGYLPAELFSLDQLFTLRGIIMMVLGGFLIGFGTRYAGGCTSGHAISGLSNLQLPSLVAVIGFFIGGLLMTHILLPFILKL